MRTRRARRALRRCSAGSLLLASGMGMNAWAQQTSQVPQPLAYEDRVLDAGAQAPQDDSDDGTGPGTGWPRGWRTELQSSQQNTAGLKTHTETLLFSGYLETPDYGALSAYLNLNNAAQAQNGLALINSGAGQIRTTPFSYSLANTWRIDQRGMPFDGGWVVNNSMGDINMASTPMARSFGRVALPSLPIEGITSSVERPGEFSLNASAGRLGFFDGIVSQGFTTGRGTAYSLGAQARLAGAASVDALGRSDAAVQFIDARGYTPNGVAGYAQDTRSAWAALAWQGIAPWSDTIAPGFGGVAERVGGLRVQANLVHSATQPADADSLAPREGANGAWLDATWRSTWLQQSVALYRFDPGLRWGAEALPNDLRGAAWRGDIITRQWQLGTNLELSDSVSGLQQRSFFGNVFGRYRFDSRDALTATLAGRTGSLAAQSLQATWEHLSDWGFTQWRNDVAHSADLNVLRSTLDHTWALGDNRTLSTTLGLEQDRRDGGAGPAQSLIWGVLGSLPLPLPFMANARLDLNLRGTQGISGNPSRFLGANASVSWPIGRGWSVIAQYAASNGREALDPTVVSALTAATLSPVQVLPSSRAFLVALRYEDRAGNASAPLGGAPGAGAGRLEGVVYLDHNANGRREASEAGVPNVMVLLDKRYTARTDAQGRYVFPAVAAGAHEVELVQDNLPLPWSSPGESGTQQVRVFVRDTATATFGVTRGTGI